MWHITVASPAEKGSFKNRFHLLKVLVLMHTLSKRVKETKFVSIDNYFSKRSDLGSQDM